MSHVILKRSISGVGLANQTLKFWFIFIHKNQRWWDRWFYKCKERKPGLIIQKCIPQALPKCKVASHSPDSENTVTSKVRLRFNTTALFTRREVKLNFSSWSCRGIRGSQKVIIQLESGQDTGVSTAALKDCAGGLCSDHQHCLLLPTFFPAEPRFSLEVSHFWIEQAQP